ncbi:ADP-ribosylhydrolase MavL family protein [Candidatus Protochlamydia phocaeensis]|uniref:ADP-ribosylhydrolase MavL family protein n=1 Tax=Candidatus Protochlamydia phocaeensis TaxID=1414722 RepID=UPI00083880D5|nr:DUF4804 domain-containing protein [Candidatus Protochlamydia phocaeensis]
MLTNISSSSIANFIPFSIGQLTRVRPLNCLIYAIALGILATSLYFTFSYLKNRFSYRQETNAPIPALFHRTLPPSLPPTCQVQPVAPLSPPQEPLLTFDLLVQKSQAFAQSVPFPTVNNLIKNFAVTPQLQTEVLEHARATRPILHAKTFHLIEEFLNHKRQTGSAIEKALYQTLSPEEFLDRLLSKRPLMFMQASDQYLLRDGKRDEGGFETIGTAQEQSPLCLSDYLSYDEMQLSALIGVSVPTHFINTGSRYNYAKLGKKVCEAKGIYVGLVGARFERPGVMEFQHMLITPEQNCREKGYGRLADPSHPQTQANRMWAKFYGEKTGEKDNFPSFEEAVADQTGQYLCILPDCYLNKKVYKERLKLILEPFLQEANQRAKEQNKQAYLHLAGLGLGVWKVCDEQSDLMLEVYAELLAKHEFAHISDLHFAYFPPHSTCGGVGDGESLHTHGRPIKIHFSNRDPADRLEGENQGKLLVAQYAWDGNAYPGNEYWAGALSASGDPAAACCSFIPELQNPLINPCLRAKQAFIASQ